VRPRFFKTPEEFAKWLEANYDTVSELLVGFHRKGTSPSITWPESVREALRFGWIDGVRKTMDETRYTIRFSPRRASSVWSVINIRIAEALIVEGRMHAAGLKAFGARKENRSGIYAYENRPQTMPEPYAKKFRKNPAAWKEFQELAPSYRRTAIWWIVSAKTEKTRLARLEQLIANPTLTRPPAAAKKQPKRR
jgi:uncharacterized protein YdeI (YjbR/CyaY-like superfamily)